MSDFEFDVFISYSPNDRAIIWIFAERLQKSGLRVWFDQWQLEPGEDESFAMYEGLQKSHTLIICMSRAYFDEQWSTFEHQTFLFRNLEENRHFIPILFDKSEVPETLENFRWLDWTVDPDAVHDQVVDNCLYINNKSEENSGEIDTSSYRSSTGDPAGGGDTA